MVATHYRWDFIGLSTDTKPTPETSEKVVDGSTFYCSDNSKLYVWCKNQWYEKEVSGGGGTTYTAGTGIDITDSTISVDTNTIQPKLTAGTGIDITDNTISATGGGEMTELTASDFNYPVANPDGIAIWLLEEGDYILSTGLKIYTTTGASSTWIANTYIKVCIKGNTSVRYNPDNGNWSVLWMTSSGSAFSETYFLYGTIMQGTGNSTTDVMSQKAVTDTLFKNNDTTKTQIGYNADASGGSYYPAVAIGRDAKATGSSSTAIGASSCQASGSSSVAIGRAEATSQGAIAIGYSASASQPGSIAIGGYSGTANSAYANYNGSIALGVGASASVAGEMNIGDRTSTYGYNNTAYRLLTGLYDGQSAHDAVTIGQINNLIDAINTATGSNISHIGA